MTKALLFFSFLLFALGGRCAPYATRPEGENDQQNSPAKRFSDSEDQGRYRSSLSYRFISVSVPLICIFFTLLSLFVLKSIYLKQRRIKTIHEMPSLLTTLKEHDDRDSMFRDPYLRVADTLRSTDLRSMHSRFGRSTSKRSSAQSSAKNMDQGVQQDTNPTPGVLVGLLGSPDWETGMQRQLANHQWRLRRESRETEKSQHRHTWHSQQSYAYSRYSTTRSRSSLRDRSVEQSSRRSSRRKSSLHISHISSFGEMEMDTFRDKRRRPKSLSAVVDQMNATRGGMTPDRSPTSRFLRHQTSSSNATVGGSGFAASMNAHSQRPSTISEVSTPEHSNLSLGNEASFRFRVTDCSGRMPETTSPTISPAMNKLVAPKISVESGLGSARMELSNTYEHLNTSGESSLGGSWGQLPHFPSPPATPISPSPTTPQFTNVVEVNNVTIAPYYFSERLHDGRLHPIFTNNEFLGNIGYGLGLCGKMDTSMNISYAKSVVPTFSTAEFGHSTLSEPLMPDISHHTNNYQYTNTLFSQLPPMRHENIESSSQTVLQDSETKSTYNSTYQKTIAANILNRHHSRVRSHVPFSLVAPPPAYLRSPRSFERTVRFSLVTNNLEDIHNVPAQSSNIHTASVIDLSVPVRPSPLRRVASMGSIGSSRASTKISAKAMGEASSILKESETIIECSVSNSGYTGVTLDNSTPHSSVEVPLSLKPKTSHASFFLDLGDPSTAECDVEGPSEFYSFDAYDAGQEHGFSRSQARSSGILETEGVGCLEEDIDFITGLHSESFSGLGRFF